MMNIHRATCNLIFQAVCPTLKQYTFGRAQTYGTDFITPTADAGGKIVQIEYLLVVNISIAHASRLDQHNIIQEGDLWVPEVLSGSKLSSSVLKYSTKR